jgi:rod shape-determining protein MreC
MAPANDRRTGFSRRRQYGVFAGFVLAVAGALVGAVLLVMSLFDPPLFSALRMGVAGLTTPVAATLNAGLRGIAAIPEGVSKHFFVKQENEALRATLADQRHTIVRAQAVLYENRRLRALLRLRDGGEQVVTAARLVGSTGSSGRRLALLDAGGFQGVRPGMPVRAADGLVGRVVETGPNAARVLLLTDADSVVPVRRVRDGLPAVAAGRGDGLVDIRVVSGTGIRLHAGDLFVTSGIGGLYPPGVPVARLEADGVDSVPSPTFADPSTLDVAVVERAFMPVPPPTPAVTSKPAR